MGIEKKLAEKACLEEGCNRDMPCFGTVKPKGLCFDAFNRYNDIRRRELEKEEELQSKLNNVGKYLRSIPLNDMSTGRWYKFVIVQAMIKEASAILAEKEEEVNKR